MNENAKKVYDLIHDLVKYKEGDLVYKADCSSVFGYINPTICVYCVGSMIDIDHGNGSNFDFKYYSKFGRCIGREENLFVSPQEVIDHEISFYKNKIEEYLADSSDCEQVKKKTIEYYNDCVEKWKNFANSNIDSNIRYIDFIG